MKYWTPFAILLYIHYVHPEAMQRLSNDYYWMLGSIWHFVSTSLPMYMVMAILLMVFVGFFWGIGALTDRFLR